MMTDDDRDFSPPSPEITEYFFIPKEATIPRFEFCTTLSVSQRWYYCDISTPPSSVNPQSISQHQSHRAFQICLYQLGFLSFLSYYAQVLNFNFIPAQQHTVMYAAYIDGILRLVSVVSFSGCLLSSH